MPTPLSQLPLSNAFTQLGTEFGAPTSPEPLTNPKLVAWDEATANRLGITADANSALNYFSGAAPLPGSAPLAMVYSGHQFGQFAGQLGDGRGLLLGDLINQNGNWDLHLKGAGRTPYSRFGDGRAVLRSCIREYLASIALNGLGIPTSHALCVLVGDEPVARERLEPRASLVRVAQTHVRFGSFEHFFYRQQNAQLTQLAEHVIHRHLPAAQGQPDRYLQLFTHAVHTTATLIAQWQAVGFAHGVMNTDNMSILGETFDYGPYGFMETYDPGFICNHSDHQGRYAFEQQPQIGFWNLQALAHSLSPLIDATELGAELRRYPQLLTDRYALEMRQKFGLSDARPEDRQLNADWLGLLHRAKLDYSQSFRALANLNAASQEEMLLKQFTAADQRAQAEHWLSAYLQRRSSDPQPSAQRQALMLAKNPEYVLRNYLAQAAIEAAEAGDYEPTARLADLLRNPGTAIAGAENFAQPAPEWAQHVTVSCSS